MICLILAKTGGTYLVNYNEGVITVECDKDRISHLNVGTIEDEVIEDEKAVSKFRILGKKYIEESYNVYDVNGIRKEQLYENKTTYHATVYKTLKENSKKYTLKGTVIKYVEKEKYKGLIEYKRVTIKPEEKPENKPEKNHKREILIVIKIMIIYLKQVMIVILNCILLCY